MTEIKRQLNQKLGSPLDPAKVSNALQEIIEPKYIIDCDVDPYIPNNLKIEEHIKGGQLQWNTEEVELYLCDKQKSGSIEGNKLRKKLKGKFVLNACVLDYLLANPQLIPESWKGKYIFFWGTIYRNSDGSLYVRCLYWIGGEWRWSGCWLDDRWYVSFPAAVSHK